MDVLELWRFPVKSMGGERLTEVDVDERGLEFDRAWGLYEPASDTVLTARREPKLLFGTAIVSGGMPRITTADGDDVSDDDALSDWLGRRVELRSAADGPGTFENPSNADDETDWVQWQSAGLTFHDSRSTVSLVSVATLRRWDTRRFRANILTTGAGEDDLEGLVTVGSATLSIRKPIERCVMVNRPQPGLEADRDVLRTIVRERGNRLGIGATVTSPGHVAVGDRLVPDL